MGSIRWLVKDRKFVKETKYLRIGVQFEESKLVYMN